MAQGKRNKKKKVDINDTINSKLGIVFRKSLLKEVFDILTMKSDIYRTFKALKNINTLFTHIDMDQYKGNSELEALIWLICYFSKEMLAGVSNPELIAEMVKHKPEYDSLKEDIISMSLNNTNNISPIEVKRIYDIISENLQDGYVVNTREEIINLLDDIDLDQPGANAKLRDRLFDVAQSLMDVRHQTNLVDNTLSFNSGDTDSMKVSINQTIESLKESTSILKTGIKRLNTLLSPGYQNGRIYIYLGAVSSGKAVPNSTKIPTPNGFTKMGDLHVGDYVFNLWGDPIKVTGVFPQGKQDTYQVTLSDGRTAKCNKEHLWYVLVESHGVWKPRVITTGEMINDYERQSPSRPTNHYYRYCVPANRAVDFNHQNIPIDPWVMGYIIGNGCCRERDFKISCPDEWAPNEIGKKLNIIPVKEKGGNYSWFFRDPNHINPNNRIYNKDIIGDIPEVYNKYSHEKRIPKEYLYNSSYIRLELLRGLMDSDGSISIKYNEKGTIKSTISYSTVSPGLVEDVKILLWSLGMSCGVYTRKQEGKRDQYQISIHIGNDITPTLFNYPPKLERANTLSIYKNKRRYERIHITKIEKLEEQTEQTCIMVDDILHVYLTEQFIPTHNSVILLKSALDIRQFNPGFKNKNPTMKPCVLYITMENTFNETIERLWNMMYDDPITRYSPDQATEMLCKALGIDIQQDEDKVIFKNTDNLLAQLDDVDEQKLEPNIEIIIRYYPYREISTDDLYTIIQDLADENYEVVALALDYVKRIRPSVGGLDSVKRELDRIINELKALAVIKNIPVITAQQLNRSAMSAMDNAAKGGQGDLVKNAGREHIGDAIEILEVGDWVCAVNIEYKPGTDEKYLAFKVLKRRRLDANIDMETRNITYIAHPFAKDNGLRLINDMNTNDIMSVRSLSSDILGDNVDKTNAVPRKKMETKDFEEDDI